jgi:uncharacterized protein (DUF58 family)
LIYPARRMILAAAAIAPLALLIGVFAPRHWFAGLALLVFLVVLGLVDGLIGGRKAEVDCEGPAVVGVGAEFDIEVHVRFHGNAPSSCEIALDSDPLLAAPAGLIRTVLTEGGGAIAVVRHEAVRRGRATIDQVWVRWLGPFGLAWKQSRLGLGQ